MTVHHVGVAGLADANARHQVPDEPEIHLDPGDALTLTSRRHRDRHIGLGLLAKIDRAEIGTPGPRLAKRRLTRAIAPAADEIQAETRHPQLLAPARVQPARVGDGGDPAQKPQELKVARLKGAAACLGKDRPADLLLDVLGELLNAHGRPQRLLPLQREQPRARLLVGEVQSGGFAGKQGAAHQQNEVREVLVEQPALGQ